MPTLDIPRPAPSPAPAAPDGSALVGRVRALLAAGRPGAARPLLAALRRVSPNERLLPELEARLKLREGDPAGACAVLDRALDALPDDPQGAGAEARASLCKTRVEARTLLGDHVGACVDAAEAVTLCRHDTEAKALLGLTLIELGRPADALPCLAEASRELPAHPSIRLGLVNALERLGELDAAMMELDEGILLAPHSVALRNAAVLLRIGLDRDVDAVAAAEAARAAGVADACTFGMQGHALSKLGRHDEAASAYAEALKLSPEDPYVRHLTAAGGRVAPADRAPVEYVRTLFDGYADEFEQHLIALGYRVPGLVRRILEVELPEACAQGHEAGIGPVLDLGCGTGLLALACMDLGLGPWVGVDASARMLSAARDKGLYAELAEDDLVRFLEGERRQFPVILAGDVFCYFGKLHDAFVAVAARLAPGGRFVLSLERQDDGAPVQLARSGRWAHSRRHVEEAARNAGLRCRSVTDEELRQEHDGVVRGMLVVLEHAGADMLEHAGAGVPGQAGAAG